MTRENLTKVLDDVLYGSISASVVYIYTRFQAVRLVKDANNKWPAFTLSDSLLTLELPGGYHFINIEGIDLITAN